MVILLHISLEWKLKFYCGKKKKPNSNIPIFPSGYFFSISSTDMLHLWAVSVPPKELKEESEKWEEAVVSTQQRKHLGAV